MVARPVHFGHPENGPRGGCAERQTRMVIFALGMMVGTALGIVVVGFLAVRAYSQGYDEALERRKVWRGAGSGSPAPRAPGARYAACKHGTQSRLSCSYTRY